MGWLGLGMFVISCLISNFVNGLQLTILVGPSMRATGRGTMPLLHVNPLNWGYGTTTLEVGSSMGATNNDPDPQSS